MRFFALIALIFAMALPVAAQESEDDKTWLEGKLQDALSGAGRNVTITGFEGALSSNARLRQLTISDANGVWLTMRDAQLVWTRRALFAGRLEIQDLTAAEIEITRVPSTEEDLTVSDSAARPFALPELPVSVNIDTLRVSKILLGEDVLGEPATLTVEGNVRLQADGEGEAALEIVRTDRNDRLTLDGTFSNATRVLALDLDFREAEDGIVSNLLNIPGTPALGLSITGEAPVSDYMAQIALSSDGQPRFGGQVTVSADEEGGYAVGAELDGDVRPLFAPELHPFFGESSSLLAEAVLRPDGSTSLERLEIDSGALELSGTLDLNADGWPQQFELSGVVEDGERVRLPVSGPPTSLRRAEITASYDAARANNWTVSAVVQGLQRPGVDVEQATFSGTGSIGAVADTIVTGDLEFLLEGAELSDPALASALGPDPKGSLRFEWKPDAPFHVAPLILESGDMQLRASGFLDNLAEGLPVNGKATVRAGDLARFSGLAGRDLAGAAEATVEGTLVLLSGAFDVEMSSQTDGLQVDDPRLDPLLRGRTNLNVDVQRTEQGTILERLELRNDDAEIMASGTLNPESGQIDINARLAEVSLLEPRLNGAAQVEAAAGWQNGQPITLDRLVASLGETRLTASGQLDPDDPALPVEGEMSLSTEALSRFADLVGRPLAGTLTLDMTGAGEIQGETFDLSFDLSGGDLRTGIAPLDTLLAGQISASGSAALTERAFDLRYLRFEAPRLRLNASGNGPGTPVALSARLSDLGLLTSGISGPAEARGNVVIEDRLGQNLRLDLTASGPGGVTAQIDGTVRDYGQSLALNVNGTAPLQLANQFISPRSIEGPVQFDLSVDGPPALSSLSGQVNFSEARVALPNLNYALTDLTGDVALSNGRAVVGVTGSAGEGGRFEVQGPITLTPPYPATLDVTLSNLVLTDSELYYTTVNGDLGINGALLGGARISGTVNLGKTELRIPSGSGVILGTLPDINHIAEPADVRRTRARADLIDRGNGNGAAANFPIDLTINAPNRIFVRGRGLDAELGGQLRLTGTTADVRPSGVFELIRGRLDILGKRLVLTDGLVDLRGSLDPYLRFVAELTSDEVLVRVILEGLLSEPEVIFTSIPDLPSEEIVARLLFGRGLDSISAFQAAQLVSAVAQLTGRYDGGVVGKLRSSLGLSDLDISTTDEGATQLRAGAYIADNVYTEVTVDSEGKEQVNLNLDVSDHFTVRGRANTDGETGIGVFFEKDY